MSERSEAAMSERSEAAMSERKVQRGLLVAGTTSDAGKSVLTAGICRWLRRRGVRVAPFKAQNMSNNSAVVLDEHGVGGEIGRAQAMQAAACGIAPSVRHNPVLLKPDWLSAQLGVPVVEGIGAPIRMAALLVSLGLKHSRVRWAKEGSQPK